MSVISLHVYGEMNLPKANKIVIKKGKHVYPDGLTINDGEILIIKPGAHLKIGDKASILVNGGKIIAEGTRKDPIIFEATNKAWRGLQIQQRQQRKLKLNRFWKIFRQSNKLKKREYIMKIHQENIINNCIFKKMTSENNKGYNHWEGAIEVKNSSLFIVDTELREIDNLCGILVQNSNIIIKQSKFISKKLHRIINISNNSVGIIYKNVLNAFRNKPQPTDDGIWLADSVAFIYGNTIKGIADDAIDLKNTRAIIYGNNIISVGEDGIDLDRKSKAYIISNKIKKVSDNAIRIAGRSNSLIVDNEISQVNNGIALIYGAKVIVDNINIQNNNNGIVLVPYFARTKHIKQISDIKMDPERRKSGIRENELYLRDSAIKNNRNDIVLLKPYSLFIKNVDFTSKAVEENIKKMSRGRSIWWKKHDNEIDGIIRSVNETRGILAEI
ncbi:right-handed parallel beta-helix repeat-containing protein [Candidatus Margulisiibacteriota bacterium]